MATSNAFRIPDGSVESSAFRRRQQRLCDDVQSGKLPRFDVPLLPVAAYRVTWGRVAGRKPKLPHGIPARWESKRTEDEATSYAEAARSVYEFNRRSLNGGLHSWAIVTFDRQVARCLVNADKLQFKRFEIGRTKATLKATFRKAKQSGKLQARLAFVIDMPMTHREASRHSRRTMLWMMKGLVSAAEWSAIKGTTKPEPKLITLANKLGGAA